MTQKREPQDGDIIIFKNKPKTEKHPVATGNVLFLGKQRNIALWRYKGKDIYTNPNAQFKEKTSHVGHVDIDGKKASVRFHYHGDGELENRRPNMTGYITVGDFDYKVAVWEKTSPKAVFWVGNDVFSSSGALPAEESNDIVYDSGATVKNSSQANSGPIDDGFGTNSNPISNSGPVEDSFDLDDSVPF